ncbi:MAG: M20/M25/M40 family metallo-hydrolase [Opitutaceae bacterium]|nr:M20/M25/M40 family metallo-hydrolase [Opitutaceae bacterium]
MSTSLRVLASILSLLATAAFAASSPPARSTLDWNRIGDEATQLLSAYLRINTANPPGNEKAAADFLRETLARDGITATIWEPVAGKANLLARVPGSGRKRPMILLHHMDVVPAARAFWTVDPFGGVVKDGYVWGRGAIDTKGLGIAELVALLTLKRQGIMLDRDVIYLATSDEEIGGVLGAGDVTKHHADALGKAEFVLNEGGNIVTDETGKPLYYGVLAAEKAPFWLEVTARGMPGHGSIPRDDSAPNKLVRALEKIRTWPLPLVITPVVERYIRAIAPTVDPALRPLYADIRRAVENPAARQQLAKNPRVYALLRNTISITVIEGSNKTNVIPPLARAELDVRLLPGQDPQAFLADIRRVATDLGVEIRPLGIGWPPPESSLDSAFYDAIAAVTKRHDPGVPVVPLVSTGFTDSHYFMELGMTCYGFAPFKISERERERVHGNDERLSVENLRRGTQYIYELLQELSGR